MLVSEYIKNTVPFGTKLKLQLAHGQYEEFLLVKMDNVAGLINARTGKLYEDRWIRVAEADSEAEISQLDFLNVKPNDRIIREDNGVVEFTTFSAFKIKSTFRIGMRFRKLGGLYILAALPISGPGVSVTLINLETGRHMQAVQVNDPLAIQFCELQGLVNEADTITKLSVSDRE